MVVSFRVGDGAISARFLNKVYFCHHQFACTSEVCCFMTLCVRKYGRGKIRFFAPIRRMRRGSVIYQLLFDVSYITDSKRGDVSF